MMHAFTKALDLLQKHWGFAAFRTSQEPIIRAALEGQDTLALLPTGGGKSICFQVPGVQREGLCLVVSPLIALMQDQVENLQKRVAARQSANEWFALPRNRSNFRQRPLWWPRFFIYFT